VKLAVLALAVVLAAPGGGTWRKEPLLRFSRSAHAVASTGSAIYALGGSGSRGAVMDVERFDGRRWTVETRLPVGLNAPAAVVLGGKLYVIGGFDGTSNVPTDRVDVYDLAAKSWSRAASLPAPRGGHVVTRRGGNLILEATVVGRQHHQRRDEPRYASERFEGVCHHRLAGKAHVLLRQIARGARTAAGARQQGMTDGGGRRHGVGRGSI